MIDLVAKGSINGVLEGTKENPAEITFFRSTTQRHTNFAMAHKYYQAATNGGSTQTWSIERDCDLVAGMYAKIELPALTIGTYVDSVGFKILESAEIKIGGMRIDQITGHSLEMQEELSGAQTGKALKGMIGRGISTGDARTLYVPLKFWFTENHALALPLVALAYHSVKVTLKLKSLADITLPGDDGQGGEVPAATAGNIHGNISLHQHNVLLDNEERSQFAKAKFDLVIRQHQHLTGKVNQSHRLDFNHAVSALNWCVTRAGVAGYQAMTGAQLKLNNQNRFEDDSDAMFFKEVVAHKHYSCVPTQNVYAYSFALNPENALQPSGSTNFSRIDNVSFIVNGTPDDEFHLVGVNYNVLRVHGGMAGTLYAN